MSCWLIGIPAAAAAVGLLWLAALRTRRGQPGWETLGGYRYAHRGLHDAAAGRPENSLSAFRAAAERGFGVELDVHLMADGGLAVIHDSELDRVCGKHAVIEQLRREDLRDYPLLGSGETIPLLEQALAVLGKRVPVIVELKVRGNAAALADVALERLEKWEGTYCVESFNPAALARLRRRWPHVIRGQLSQNFLAGDRTGLGSAADWLMTHLLVCALSRPDFVAYNWKQRDSSPLRLMKKLYGVHEVSWTVRDRETMERLEAEGATVIFEGFVPEGPLAEKTRK